MNYFVERKPDNFDWVTARTECSSFKIFAKLRMLIAEDVEIRNALRRKDSFFFALIEANERRFSVVGEMYGGSVRKSVMFTLQNNKILASTAEKIIFEAEASLGNDGECRAKIGDKEHDLWQLRKMALEELFFAENQESQ
jgi:hypothetical protein